MPTRDRRGPRGRPGRRCLAVAIALLGGAAAAYGEELPAVLAGAHEAFQHPVRVESGLEDRRLAGEVWSVAPGRYAEVRALLEQPEHWCDIVSLHLNVKACVHYTEGGRQRIVMYLGYKVFQTPEEAHPLDVELELASDAERIAARMVAGDGPYGTSDYELDLEARPLAEGRTLLHFEYAYRFSWIAEAAMRLFLETWARHKVGFSLDDEQQPIRGFRGLVERNSIRYHLALQAFLEHPGRDEAAREGRWRRWFELTERHARQLHEIERDEYLDAKRREHRERLRLQAELDARVSLTRSEPG